MTDEEARYAAFAAVEDARKADDAVALGRAFIHLSRLAHQVGLGTGNAAFADAAKYGREAVAIFREIGSPRDFAIALRAAAVPFVTGVDRSAMLLESIALAESIGDIKEESNGRLALGQTQRDAGELSLARELFASIGDSVGEGLATQSFAIQTSISSPEKAALLERSADLMLRGKQPKEAHRALITAEIFGRPDIGPDERMRLLH